MSFIKRKSFKHELEYRFILTFNEKNIYNKYKNGIKLVLTEDMCDVIHKVFIDPFASPHLTSAIKEYFQKIGVRCSQSSIYKEPS